MCSIWTALGLGLPRVVLRRPAEPADASVLRVFGHDGSDGTWGIAIPKLDLMVLYFTQSRGGATLWKVMDLVRGLVEGSRST